MIRIDHLPNLSYISAAAAERDTAPLCFDTPRMSRATADLFARIERQMEVVRMWQTAQKEMERSNELHLC